MSGKNKVTWLLVMMLMFSGTPAFAQNPVIKLSRGLVNIISSPLEYYIQYNVLSSDYHPGVAAVATTVYGTGFMLARVLGGVYEAVTFPVPLPENYAPVFGAQTPLDALREMHGVKDEK